MQKNNNQQNEKIINLLRKRLKALDNIKQS
jgi:hypothetical protein